MRLPIVAAVLIVLVPATAACTQTPSGTPAPATSTANRKSELCRVYWQGREESAKVRIETLDALFVPDAPASRVEEAKQKIRAAYDKQRSRLEAELAKPGDAEITALFQDYLAKIKELLAKLQSAGSDASAINDILADDGLDQVERKVFPACEAQRPSPQAG